MNPQASDNSGQIQHTSLVLALSLGIYSFLVSILILSGRLSPAAQHFAMAVVPLALAVWFGYGFMQPSTSAAGISSLAPDYGLLLSCGGWGLVAISLLLPQSAPGLETTTAGTTMSATSATAMTASICGVIGILCLLMGAILSFRNWQQTISRS